MGSWDHIVVEGICQAMDPEPCGHGPAPACLGSGDGTCPYLLWSPSTEREAAQYVPLRLVLWDRVAWGARDVGRTVKWHCWKRWTWQRKWDEFRAHMQLAEPGECAEWDAYQDGLPAKYAEWAKRQGAGE